MQSDNSSQSGKDENQPQQIQPQIPDSAQNDETQPTADFAAPTATNEPIGAASEQPQTHAAQQSASEQGNRLENAETLDLSQSDFWSQQTNQKTESAPMIATIASGLPYHRPLALRLRERKRRIRTDMLARAKARNWFAFFTVIMVIIIGFIGFGGYYSVSLINQYQQNILALAQNVNMQSTKIYDRNGVLLYQTYNTQATNAGLRTDINYCQLPNTVIWATVDTEDRTFFTNYGVDPTSVFRAAYADYIAKSPVQGASTITQQVVKNLVLNDSNKSLHRKIDEAILALDLAQTYSKQDILTIYLNDIPYGGIVYGIESAAEVYFHYLPKTININPQTLALANGQTLTPDEISFYQHAIANGCIPKGSNQIVESAAWQLQPWQAALLAGVPDNPSSYMPYSNPENALARMQTVLKQIFEYSGGKYFTINNKQATSQQLYQQAYNAIHIQTKQDPANYQRQIYYEIPGSSHELAPYFVNYVISQLSDMLPGGFGQFASLGWNIYTTLDYGNPNLTDADLAKIYIDPKTGQLAGLPASELQTVGLQQYADFITRQDIIGNTIDGYKNVFYDYWFCGSGFATQTFTYLSGPNPFASPGHAICLSKALGYPSYAGGKNVNDAALVALDPRNGDILAMVGGVNYNSSDPMVGGQNNLAIDPRSMGSAFKPTEYSTAFEMGWNPGTVLTDQPTCFPNSPQPASVQSAADRFLCGYNYLPHDYTTDQWSGPQPLTYLLGNSLNPPAELTLAFDGMQDSYSSPFFTMAARLGLPVGNNPGELSTSQFGAATAIGVQPVPLISLTSEYATFAANGVHHNPRSILTITNSNGGPIIDAATGKQLFAYNPFPQGYQAISPQAAYMVSSILSNNEARDGDFGPNNPLNFYGRSVAAKTGTSQNVVDITTFGYTPWITLGVWSGNADGTPADPNIIGIAGAGYIFNAVMSFAIDHFQMPGTLPSTMAAQKPGGYFPIPAGMHLALLSCSTGLAPYPGHSATQPCNPSAAPIPPQMWPEFQPGNMYTNYMPPFRRGSYYCLNWGCVKDYGELPYAFPGLNYAWVINGQDPTHP